jgi:hypothetical protein
MSIYNAVSLLELLGPDTEILEPTPAFVHDRRGTSSSVLFHPYPRDVCSSSFTASFAVRLFLLQWRVSSLQRSLSFAVTHLQSLTTGLCPGNQQFTYFCRLSTSNNLLALNSLWLCLCNNSKIRPFLRAEVLLRRFFFLTLDGFSIIFNCQNKTVSFST